jgi:CDP-diacylglycerol---glycerol-3-phosphate 3-phosphatidyltransferase
VGVLPGVSGVRGLYALKPWYARRLGIILDRATRASVSPDVFTGVGVAGAVGAAACLFEAAHHRFVGVAVLPLLAVRLAGANLDGALARARGVSRPWGAVLNELGDRASDVVLFVACVPIVGAALAGWSALAASLPTFASLCLWGTGMARINGGPVGKTERCLAFSLAGIAIAAGASPSVAVTVACWVAALGGVLTAGVRLRNGYRELGGPSTTLPTNGGVA